MWNAARAPAARVPASCRLARSALASIGARRRQDGASCRRYNLPMRMQAVVAILMVAVLLMAAPAVAVVTLAVSLAAPDRLPVATAAARDDRGVQPLATSPATPPRAPPSPSFA